MLDFHPLANLFPLIEGQAFADLVADVKTNGLIDRIVILDGRILDGRNRYRAGIAAGVIDPDAPAHNGTAMQPWCELYLPEHEGDPLAWVLSKNLHRRHLDESQRSAVGAKLETLGPSGKVPDGADANLQRSRAEIAQIVNVSERTIASSKKVLKHGAPELFEAIERGTVKASVAEKLLALPKDRQAEVVTTLPAQRLKTLAKQATRQLVETRLADKQRALPTRLFGVIQADPAWQFEPYNRDTGLDRAADNHYPTQATDEIKKLPVGTIAANDCVLFLWATAPMLADALAVMRFWGFTYKSQVIWRKVRDDGALAQGTGYWFRNAHEVLLVGTKGNIPAPAPGEQWPSVFDAVPGRHSEKPERAYELIEAYYPNLPKIELNARRARPGWEAWGKEAPEGNSPEIPDSSSDLRAAYEAAVEAAKPHFGKHTWATAEPVMRAAYACEPIVPTKEIKAALGAPIGTVLGWAGRHGLSKPERRGGPDGIGQKRIGGGS